MELNTAETSLVVAGAWNAAILTPAWMFEHALPGGPPDRQVQVFIPAGLSGLVDAPRYLLPELTYVVRSDALVVSPSDATIDQFNILEAAVAGILEVLKHTPVSGIGHNFEFRDPDPDPAYLSVFSDSRQDLADSVPEEWQAAAATVHSSFQRADATVLMNVQRHFDAGTLSIKFNFHHPISNAAQAISVLNGTAGYKTMQQNLDIAKALINSVYQVTI